MSQKTIEELYEIIELQQNQIKELQRKVQELEKKNQRLEKENQKLHNQLRKFLNENTPSGSLPPYLKDELKQMTTDSAKDQDEENIKSSKFNPRNQRKEKYDKKELHEIKKCPCCGSTLKERKKRLRKRVIHLKLPEIEDTLHESKTYYCENCKKEVVAPVPDTLPKSKFDLNISLLVLLLYVLGMTQRKIREFLGWFGLSLSNASVNNIVHRIQNYLGDKRYKQLEDEIKKSISSGADETSHRYRGKTFWIWAVATIKTIFYRIEKDRRYYRVRKLPTGKYITCDGYRAYDSLDKKIQRCWAHLLRKARTPEYPFSSDEEVEQYIKFVEEMAKIYNDAKNTKERTKELKEEFDNRLKEFLLKPRRQEKNLIKIINYILKYEGEWFTFLERRGIEPTNNRCERALRPLVIRRKVSQHNWSIAGLQGLAITQSLYETCKLRNENFIDLIKNEIEANIHEKENS